jgi:hypothetical protein
LAFEEQYKITNLSFENPLQVIDKIMFARCLFGHLAGHIFVEDSGVETLHYMKQTPQSLETQPTTSSERTCGSYCLPYPGVLDEETML